ncbi:VWD domain-containing protein [Jatrophihabitans sp.]|uniref:VWD domain-containing protein n=1 Tax=Jatrophihabitans sp. TaxID=1932789 RepID=UPI002CDF2461|nr:VWD domain-containing protein [Jatrophihabitans sp.]
MNSSAHLLAVRRLCRSAVILFLTVAVPVAACQLTPARATTPVVAGASTSAATDCPPNSSDQSLGRASRCVAEMMRSTRGFLRPECFDTRALTPDQLYRLGECKGLTTIQAEAIAQTRAIVRFNSQSVFGDSAPLGSVTANLQWEVSYPKPAGAATGGRVDILMYDRTSPGSPMQAIEVKNSLGGVGDADAEAQLIRYQRDFPTGPTNRPLVRYNLAGYSDKFRILVRECSPTNDTEVVYNYTAGPTGRLGVLLVSDPTKTTRKCQDDPTPVPTAASPSATASTSAPTAEPTSTPTGPPVLVPPVYRHPGADDDGNGKDDFWEDFIKDHPELDDLPIPDAPTVSEPLVKVAVAVGAAAILVALAGACIAGGCLAALGIAAVETGAATIGTLILITVAGLAALIGWNIFGDPHLATPDRFTYDLQSVGEFHLLEVPDEGIDIQARFTPSGPNVSLFNTVAFEINDTWVELGNGTLKINGVPTSLSGGTSYDLGDGAAVLHTGRFYSVLWPGYGDRLSLMWSGSNVGLHVPKTMRTRGLLGNSNGNPADDLELRDGTPLPANTSDTVLHGRFADSWRITDDDSRFSYGAGQTTATFTDRAFPARVITLGDFTEAEIAVATETCQLAGVSPGPQFEDCVFDVVTTGDDTYAQAAAEVTQVLVDSASHFFDDTGNLAEDFEGAVGANFVAPRYTSDPSTTRVAGPLFDTPGYRMTARSVTRHKSIRLRADLYAYGNIGSDSVPQTVSLILDGTPAGQVNFEGADGPTLSGGLTGSIERVGVNTTVNGIAYSKFALDVTLSHSASSANLEFVPKYFRGVLNTSLGIDNIKMTLEVPPANTFDVALPLTVPSVQAAIEQGAGTLETAGAQDEYRFSLAAPAALAFDAQACLSALSAVLTETTTGVRTTLTTSCGDFTTAVVPAGSYRVEVQAAQTGNYSFALFVKPDPQVFDLGALGSSAVPVSDGVPASGAGRLETKASEDDYRFGLPAAGSVALIGTCSGTGSTSGYLSWRLVKDDGSNTTVSSGTSCPARVLTGLAAGDYRLVVKPQAEYTGSYAVDFLLVPDAQVFPLGSIPPAGITVSDGVPGAGAGNLETKVSQDELRFTLDAAQALFLDFAGSAITPAWQLLRADGSSVVSTSGNYRIDALPAGDYRLLVGSRTSIGSTGKYTVKLSSAVPQSFDIGVLTTTPVSISDGVPGTGAGRLESKAAEDDYRFSLPAAGSASLTGTCSGTGSTSGYLSWRLAKDDGSNTTVSSGSSCPAKVFANLAAGDYRLVVKPQYEYTGSYALDFMLVPDAQVFPLGTLTGTGVTVSDGVPAAGAGNLETKVSQDELRFTLDAAQALFLDFAGSPTSPGWQLLRADGSSVVSTSGSYRIDALPAGDYRLLVGSRTSIATAGKYTVQLTVAVPQAFDLGTLATTQISVSDGIPAAGAGRLEAKASEDDYRFTLAAAGSVMVNGSCSGTGATSGYLSWRLVKDDGTNTTISSGSSCPVKVFANLAAGDYRLVVKPQYEYTGSYRLDFMLVPDAQVFSLGTLPGTGLIVTDGVPGAGAGNLETKVSQDELRFTLDVTQALFLDFAGSATSPGWQLLRADGSSVVSTSGSYRIDALPAGDYRLLLGSRTSIATAGKYTVAFTSAVLQTFDLAALGSSVTSVSDGVPAAGAGRLESKASEDDYRFTLPTPGSVMLTGSCSGSGSTSGYLSWRVVKDDGSNTSVGSGSSCPNQVISNLAAGNYRLVVKPQYEYTGSYRLDFMLVPDVQVYTLGAIPSAGVTVSDGAPGAGAGNLETKVSQDELRFTLDATQALFLDFAGSPTSPGWQLLRADGSSVVSTSGSYRVDALPAGDYRLLLGTRTGIGTAGKYSVKLVVAVPQAFDLGTLTTTQVSVSDGIPGAGAGRLESKASEDDYRFTLPAAGSVMLTGTCSGTGSTSGYLSWRLVKDDGSNASVGSGSSCPNQVISNVPAGNYRLVVKPQYEYTGSYRLDFMLVPDAQIFTLGTIPVAGVAVSDGVPGAGAGNLETKVSQDELRFSLDAAQALFLDFAGSATSPGWQLLRADGSSVVSTSGSYRVDALAVGDYRLLLGSRTSIGTAGKYSLTLTPAVLQTFDLGVLTTTQVSISDGVPGTGAGRLESKAAEDDYRFTLPAAGSVALTGTCSGTGSTNGYLAWRLVKDDGSYTTVTSGSSCPAKVFTNLAAGNYLVTVKPQYEYTGSYRLDFMVAPDVQVFTLGTIPSAGVAVSDGVPSAGAGNLETKVSQDELRFSLDAVQTLFLDFAGSPTSPGWQLLRADGSSVVSTSGNYRVEGLPAGDYRLLLGTRTSIGTPGKYTVKLSSAVPQSFDLGVLTTTPVPVSDGVPGAGAGRLEVKPSEDDYRFTLPAAGSVALTGTCSGTGSTNGYLAWRLVKDDGSNTTISSGSSCPAKVFANLAAGNYLLTVKPQYEYTGFYALDFMVVPDVQTFALGTLPGAGVTVSDGVPSAGAGNLETKVSQDELRFSLDAAQTLFLDFAGSATSPGWQLLRADGSSVVSTSGNYRVEGLAVGDYRLLLGTRTSIGTPGKYALKLTPAPVQAFDLGVLGTSVVSVSDGVPGTGAGRLEVKPSEDDYRFSLAAAQSVMLLGNCSGTGSTNGYLAWRLVKDDGSNTTITSGSSCPAKVFANLVAGNYLLTVKPQYEYTGFYTLDFMVVPDVQTFALGTLPGIGLTVSDGVPSAGAGNLETKVSQDELRFTLDAAQTLFLDFAGSATSPGWQLLRADGSSVVSASGNYRVEGLAAGDYRLLLGSRTSIATAGKYTVQLTVAVPQTFDLGTLTTTPVPVSDGVPAAGAGRLENKAAQDDYRFTLAALGSVTLTGSCSGTGSTNGYLSWRLVKDDGSNTTISSGSSCPAKVFTNLAAGNYRLVAKPQYEYTGSYQLSFKTS